MSRTRRPHLRPWRFAWMLETSANHTAKQTQTRTPLCAAAPFRLSNLEVSAVVPMRIGAIVAAVRFRCTPRLSRGGVARRASAHGLFQARDAFGRQVAVFNDEADGRLAQRIGRVLPHRRVVVGQARLQQSQGRQCMAIWARIRKYGQCVELTHAHDVRQALRLSRGGRSSKAVQLQ